MTLHNVLTELVGIGPWDESSSPIGPFLNRPTSLTPRGRSARGEGLVVRCTRGNGTTDVLEIPSYTLVMCARKGDPNC